MKKIYIKFSALVFAGLLLSTSCTKDFSEINTNPNSLNSSNFDPNTLLPTIQQSYSGNASSNIVLAANVVQLMSNAATSVDLKMTTFDKYLDNDSNNWMQEVFQSGYSSQVKSVVALMDLTKDNPKYANLYQIARIMKALVFQRITDTYGDVPYFDAGQAYNKRIFYPKYDKQQTIYADLAKELEEASNALNLTGDKPTGDEMFKGDIAKWKRFGYSLLLRVGMRLVKVDEPGAKAIALKAVSKTMLSNADNAFIKGSGADKTSSNNANSRWLLGDSGYNPWYIKWSKTFIDYLKNNNDPRLTRVARVKVWVNTVGSLVFSGQASGDASLQKGLPNGLNESTNNNGFSMYYDPSWTGPIGDPAGLNNYSLPNPAMFLRNGPTFFLTYAETELLLAEAAFRWGSAFGTPQEHYNNGVTASMTYLTQYDASMSIPASEINAYLAANPYNAAKALELINTQYWAEVATTLDFHEAWINWRRSGFPVLKPVNYPGNITGATIPRRYAYPVGEKASNLENLNVAVNALAGGDKWTSRVWWDK
jgi:hypothetical protein